MSSESKSLFLSDQFVISCGTVSVDLANSKVLLIRWRKTGEHLLPKGRKDINETLEETAMRETLEETGMRVRLLPVAIPTLATLPSGVAEPPETVTEPIAMTQRTTADGTLKVIFWFVAAVRYAVERAEGTQQEDEDFETVWADFDDVESTLDFDDDRRVAKAAIDAVRALSS